MTIIVQAGHRSSKSKLLMQKLYDRGLSEPLNSYNHQLMPQQIADTINKIILRNNTSTASNKLVDNVMIDFLLSNLNSENWGWESENNLVALEYWQHIESDVRFILVFDHPNNLLDRISSKAMTVELLNQTMSDWVTYHQNMLDFLDNSQDKTLLIEGMCAIDNISKLGEQVKTIAHTLQLKSSWQVLDQTTDTIVNSNPSLESQANVVKDHIFAEVLSKYPEVIKLFNILLDKASIKTSDSIYKTKRTSLDSLVDSLNYIKNEQSNELFLEKKDQLNQELSRELQDANSKVQILDKKSKETEKKLESLKLSSQPKNSDLEKENDLLITQIQQLQEELERYYIESQKMKNNKASKKESNLKDVEKKPTYYGAAERVKQDLPYKIGEKIVKAKKPKDIVSLPFVLVKEYRNFQKNEISSKPLPAIELYKDAYEADRVKEHLSYRVGQVIVNSTKSPKSLVSIPKNLSQEIANFYKKKKNP